MYQLRIYKVNLEKREAFHDRFKNHAMRIMKKYAFSIVAMWETVTESDMEFIYILDWPNVETMEHQWKAFLADQEWIDIKKKMDLDIGEPVIQATGRVLTPIEYSPLSTIQVP
ncbi:NIPSNAP family protein [Pectobacteriaceae bacterium CE70]|uniref:NIPSNAP family containing protein n=1 Tax=Serratia sp. (strain ATCC 39006) TaxID=104623 RepID=A0A2I5TF31_SERS3|nr:MULTISPECIES: NIPSNAP family protein [Enterobacterales]WJV58233.1 NIPSNAP family protein [Pectobacteriaceae bacterium C111]WJV62522.1 NIPSNAP family protein [Pectobacteriaceae bacterium C52]WJV66841.1 NIPSNAP family protein [Pectobacteriaceae bacterium CE70]WJY10833.1 NIPSNAP family protein [Pectobacteriaceae bacterium C80]AUG98858.1 NIPSNAP family containing protein [Serratia sp. ATCC 39006]